LGAVIKQSLITFASNQAKIFVASRCGHNIPEHFPDVGKTIKMPQGAEKEIDDLMLTRYACYLIAQNGDSKKEAIAFMFRNVMPTHFTGGFGF
jgi:DNA-directed RNA polymerase subunit N (RpoN/RPB10)